MQAKYAGLGHFGPFLLGFRLLEYYALIFINR
jgi:hypothetical protein